MEHLNKLIESLKFRWQTLLQSFLTEPELGQKVFVDLVNTYSSVERSYHNLGHIHQVLETIEQSQSLSVDFVALQFAGWFHDIIYDSKAKDNEEKSAEYAEAILSSLKIPKSTIAHVKDLILSTKSHQALFTDIDSHILLDADLTILGSSQSDYRAYARAIRQEYSWRPDAEYIVGRKGVLKSFLQRDRIYLTHKTFVSLEEKARQNLQSEVAALSLKRLKNS